MRDDPHTGDSHTSLRPYEAIHEHAELELELVGRGEIESLGELGERWEQLTRDLPARPPAAAAALLRQARLIHERTRIELIRLRESLLAEIGTSARARRAADGYGGQLARRPRLDRSA
ncbi:MAG TPA: hypothetical protein VGP18_13895 [Solirubrobacteraceae bacterium]|jgi:hypothetical protein|nr:hypothetical protein [Solirubrobacteraceae bacterium]